MGRPWSTGASLKKSTERARASTAELKKRGGAVVCMRLNARRLDRIDLLAQKWRMSRPRTIWKLAEWAMVKKLDRFI